MLMRFDTSNLFLFGTNICALQNRTAKKKRDRDREREREREREGGWGGEGAEKKEEKSQAISPARSIRSARFGNRARPRAQLRASGRANYIGRPVPVFR